MRNPINPEYKKKQVDSLNIDDLIAQLHDGDRYALSKCITLIESKADRDHDHALQILEACKKVNHSTSRIAITGPPGAGKSTTIEALGSLLAQENQVAILAIDPSSTTSMGSILGDKTRMEQLSNHPNVYIRPSASSGNLGGVAATTKNVISICEAAGYDHIIIETVGVGQSEVEVASLVDLMILVTQPGAGDEIQGIKRGIMELADIIFVNKADGKRQDLANLSKKNLDNALHLMQPKPSGWAPKVQTGSALEQVGLTALQTTITAFFEHIRANDYYQIHRQSQERTWLRTYLQNLIVKSFLQGKQIETKIADMSKISSVPYTDAYDLFKEIRKIDSE